MRLGLAGKFAVFVLGLLGLYALWQAVPHRLPGTPRLPSARRLRLGRPEPRGHEGIVIGYAGCPPPAAVDLSRPGTEPNPALAATLGEKVMLHRETLRGLSDGLASGALDAAVLDYPTVVRAAMDGRPPYDVVLLVSWRAGADAIRTRDGRPASPETPVETTGGGSADYLRAVVFGSVRYTPADREKAKRAAPAGSGAAIAGRLDQMPERTRQWPVWKSTSDMPVPMPDVLVVRRGLDRDNPEQARRLVRAWLKGQEAVSGNTEDWKRFVGAQARETGLSADALSRQLAPASVSDQMAFSGAGSGVAGYAAMAARQARAMSQGPPPDFTVPMEKAALETAVLAR